MGITDFLSVMLLDIGVIFVFLMMNDKRLAMEVEATVKRLESVRGGREKLIVQLQKALSEMKTLKGIFPICASCKKIRDDKGYWNQIESYIRDRSNAQFSHGICPECVRKLYPAMNIYNENGSLISTERNE